MEIYGLTMVDTCTQWADATVLLNSTVKHAEKFDQVWLCSRPPIRISQFTTMVPNSQAQSFKKC
jgi:hypothetical protein